MEKNTLIKSYKESRPLYEKFTVKIKSLIEELIKEGKIEFHLVESRTKETESLQEKILKKSQKYSSISQITDLSGIRVIVYYPDDIQKIISIIDKEFQIDYSNSIINGPEYSPNEFGYISSHLIIKLNNSRKFLMEWKFCENFFCEIQIRTVLQHAWASISHALQYKNKQDVPSNLQRKLFRLASLFELADEQFLDIKKTHELLIQEIRKEDFEKTVQEINLLTLSNYLEKSVSVKEIYSIALNCGFTDVEEEPEINFENDDHISSLVVLCQLLNLKTIKDIDHVLKSIQGLDLKYFLSAQYNERSSKEGSWYVTPAFIVELLFICYSPKKFTSEILSKMGWSTDISKRVIKLAPKLINKE